MDKYNGLGRDYCSWFPEKWRKKWINQCCKQHDNDCGEQGNFNFFSQQKRFYRCLRDAGESRKWSFIIMLGGAIGCAIKSVYLIPRKILYRMRSNFGGEK